MLQLALYFALLSLISVGGIPSVMPEMQRLVVEVHHWMTAPEFTQAFAIAQAAPGPNVLVTALVGLHVAGPAGAAVALTAFCAPAGALAYSLGGLWDRMRDAPWRKTIQRALVPVIVGFVVSGGYVLAINQGLDWRSALIAGASAATLYFTRHNPLWALAGGGALGYFLY